MKFSKKLVIHKERDIPLISKGLSSKTLNDYRDIIEDYLYISRKRRGNKVPMNHLQIHLFEDLIVHYNAIKKYKEEIEKLRQQISIENHGNRSNSNYKREILHFEKEVLSHEVIIRSLKSIADGITWRLFNYNRGLLMFLANYQSSGDVEYTIGLENELREWSYIAETSEGQVILNCLTDFLRIGDVTAVLPNGNIEFIEVKSSGSKRGIKRRQRLERQQTRIDETINFFNTGIKDLDNADLIISSLDIEIKHNLDKLATVIRQSKSEGHSTIIIDDYLIIESVHFGINKDIEEYKKKHKDNVEPLINSWKQRNDRFIRVDSKNTLIFSKNLAPYSIYPLKVSDCADLMCAKTIVDFYINLTMVFKLFEKYGWRIKKTLFDYKDDIESKKIKIESLNFVIVSKNGFTVEVPASILGRITFECLNPITLVNQFEAQYKTTDKNKAKYIISEYSSEHKIWN